MYNYRKFLNYCFLRTYLSYWNQTGFGRYDHTRFLHSTETGGHVGRIRWSRRGFRARPKGIIQLLIHYYSTYMCQLDDSEWRRFWKNTTRMFKWQRQQKPRRSIIRKEDIFYLNNAK